MVAGNWVGHPVVQEKEGGGGCQMVALEVERSRWAQGTCQG